MIKINLGCGSQPIEGWVNVDLVKQEGVDIEWNLDAFPWPFEDGEAEAIRAFDVFEHVDDPCGFVSECWRVMAPDALLNVHTAYWRSENSFTDPTHKRFPTERTFDYWIVGADYYTRYGVAYARGALLKERQDGPGAGFKLEAVRLDGGTELDFWLRKV